MYLAIHLLGLVLTALVSIVTARWVYQQTNDRAGTVMIAILLMHTAMSLVVIAELLTPDPGVKLLWVRLLFPLILASPVLFLLLAIYYTGREQWLTRPVWIVFATFAVVPAGLSLTNGIHGLLTDDVRLEHEPFSHYVVDISALGFILAAIVFVNVIVASGLFLRLFLFSRRSTRSQTAAVLAGMLAIFFPTLASAGHWVPVPGFPYGVFGGALFGVIIAVGLFRARLFVVAPVARDALFESLDEGVLVVDANRAITDYNDQATELLPSLDDHLGDRLDDAYPSLLDLDGSSTDGGGVEVIIERIEGTMDTPFAGKVRITTGDTSKTVQATVSEISSGGELRGYALILRDVTDLERYAAELEVKTTQLEQFASTLSHDLRNPISVAMGYVDLERGERDSTELRYAHEALERVDETIDALLKLAREGERIDDRESVSLSVIASQAWETSDTRDATLSNEFQDERVETDPSRLKTMLENLFRNAVDHGGTTVQVGPLETDRQGFYVADDGPGIPAEHRERVFEYGFSSDPDGTGFGLAIVASIVDAHGWEIVITDSADGGARFEVTTIGRP